MGGLISLFSTLVIAASASAGTYYSGQTGEKVNESDILSRVHAGQIVIVSEQHGLEPHHQNQRDFLVKVSGAPFPISVGMEFFDYTKQEFVDQYNAEKISEEDFLKKIGWGGDDFSNYRFQVRLPHFRGGKAVALNAPRSLTGKIAKQGIASLTEEEKALLPPDFTMGADSVYERFSSVMKDHVPKEKIANYFAAHSVWDDTMAWRAAEYLKANPDQWLMIIVGDFHLAYQDGLVARLKARGVKDILSISQVSTAEATPEEKREIIAPHPKYGARADYVFDAANE